MLIPISHSAIYQEVSSEVYSVFSEESLHVFECIDSTQSQIKLVGGVNPSLVVSEAQTSGRGRFSRNWNSAGQNILMSCSWQFDSVPNDLSGLGLALIVELSEILRDDYALPVSIKWPNDLLIGGKKAAGILVDVESGASCCLYVGIGLNVEKPVSSNDDVIDQPWADMASFGAVNVDRNKLIAKLFSRWCKLFLEYPQTGFSMYRQRWNNLSEHIGKMVELSKEGKLLHRGVMKGVDRQGFLLIDINGNFFQIMDSECSLRVF